MPIKTPRKKASKSTKTKLPSKTKAEKRAEFIRALAEHLCVGAWTLSICLDMPPTSMAHKVAARWKKLRDATPLFGWPSVEEAELILAEFLG